jgi:arylsulfatase A-like enzyme
MRPSHAIASLGLAIAAASALPAQQPLAGARPNILFVFSDDHAAHAISAYGSRINQTPHIDRIADEGSLFRANFCGNALCGPSRATILTGLHSHGNGFCRNGNVFDGGQPTFPKLLQQAGYQTAIVGKWHLESTPTGFDHWVVLPDQGQYYNPDFLTKDGRVRIPGHATDVTTQLALDWLEKRDPDKPFVLMCQHKAPHRNWLPAPQDLGLFRGSDLPEPATLFDAYDNRLPARAHTEMEIARHLTLHYDLMVPPTPAEAPTLADLDRAYEQQRARMDDAQRAAWDAAFAAEDEAFRRENPQGRERVRWMYQRYMKNYLRCVQGVDRSVGALLAWLDAHPDVKANTLVVYSSDQGFFLGEHGWYDKRWMDDECLRMPLVMRWPGRIAAGREVAQLTQNIDFAPTFLELAGVPAPKGVHGRSLVPLLAGEPPADWRDAVYYHYYESQATHRVPAMYGVRTATHKLVRYYEPGVDGWELFDLVRDPDELRSVADDPAYAGVRKELAAKLVALRAQYGDDTGELLPARFPQSSGVTRIVAEDGGYRLWANAPGGWALRPQQLGPRFELTTTLRPLPGKPQQNGFVVLAAAGSAGGADSADPARWRVGIEFGAKQLVVLGPMGGKARWATALPWDGQAAVALRIAVDLARRELVAEAAGVRVTATLPTEVPGFAALGLGASNAETRFTELAVR